MPITQSAAQDNQGEVLVQDTTNTTGVQGAISVGTSAVEAKVGGSALTNRKSVTVCPTNGVVYFGYTNAVTTSSGTPITAGNILPFGSSVSVWLIAASTTDVRVTEAS